MSIHWPDSEIIGIVSGYFNPLHGGHIDYIEEAKKHCGYLIAIVNNDRQASLKYKTDKIFMDQDHRKKIVESLRDIDEAIVCKDSDMTVCGTLIYIRSLYPNSDLVFFNSGDRSNPNPYEVEVSEKTHISNMYLPLEKVYSSREYRK